MPPLPTRAEGDASPLIEHRSIDYIPLRERHGKVWHLWPVWFAGDAHLATIATGVVGISLGGNLLWMAVAVTVGSGIGTFFMAFHSTQGPQLGLPQMIQSRPQFGYIGALLIWCVALISFIGYNAFNQILAAQTFHTLYGGSSVVTIILFTILSATIAIAGYDLIHGAQRVISYILIVALFAFSVAAAIRLHFSHVDLALGDFNAIAFLAQLFTSASYQVTWSTVVSDYSRYLPRNVSVRASFWWTYVGAFTGGTWTMLVGTVCAAAFPQLQIVGALHATANAVIPGYGGPLLLCSLLGLITITSVNFYGASLTLLSIADSFHHFRPSLGTRLLTLAISIIASVALALAASHDFITRFGEFLAILLYLFTPWTAINLVDFYWVRKGHYSVREIFNPHGMYGRWNWRGLIAYGAGFVAMIPFFSTEMYVGPIARLLGGADIAMVVGLPVSAMVYLWGCRSLDLDAERLAVAKADRDLEPASLPEGGAQSVSSRVG